MHRIESRDWTRAAIELASRANGLAVAAVALAAITITGLGHGEQAAAMPAIASASRSASVPAIGPATWTASADGEKALLFNAALPFSATPPEPAKPFIIALSEPDHEQAMLCLTRAVYYEAGFEPLEGRRAVAQVVLNRVRHPAFPKSVCGVVYQGEDSGTCQFSFVCNGDLKRRPAERAWAEAERVARDALSGYVEPAVGEATHYHADYVAPQWAPLLMKVAAIGHHIFYRWPGQWGTPAAFTGRYAGEGGDPLQLRYASLTGASGPVDEMNGPTNAAEAANSRVTYEIAALLDASVSSSQRELAQEMGVEPASSDEDTPLTKEPGGVVMIAGK
jgi:spore germination cell wall hydrolase CwlJ-like protein